MSDHRDTLALILRTVEYGERDLIATVFGRDTGKFSAIAKNARGSKKRFGGGLQPLRLLRVDVTAKPNRDLDRLNEIEVVQDYSDIQTDFDKITVGSYATEFLDAVTIDRDPEPQVFDLATDFLGRLAGAEPTTMVLDVLLRHFLLEALNRTGSGPALDRCFRCGTPIDQLDKVYGMRSGEGLVCADCRRTGDPVGVLYPETIDVLDYYRRPGDDAPESLEEPQFVEQARRIVDAAVRRVIDHPLKSRAMLDSVFTGE